jgi:hypothetical protein
MWRSRGVNKLRHEEQGNDRRMVVGDTRDSSFKSAYFGKQLINAANRASAQNCSMFALLGSAFRNISIALIEPDGQFSMSESPVFANYQLTYYPSLIGSHNDCHPVPRLQLSQFQMMDAPEVFGCITPAIAKFMPWEPPSWSEYVARCEKRVQAPEPNKFPFVIRRLDNRECLGMASLEDADSVATTGR